MPFAPIEISRNADLILMVVGIALLYVASRTAVDALVGEGEASPGWRAVGHHLPMAAVALAGIWMRESALSIGVLFGASVASLSLGCGAVVVTADHPIAAPAGWRRVWPFVIVVAVLGMLAGLSGTLTPAHAGIFLLEGLVLWVLWGEGTAEARKQQVGPTVRVKVIWMFLAVLLAGVGAWATARGAVELGHGARAVTLGTVAATMIGPMLVLPMLGTGTLLATRGMGWAAVTSQIGVVLLNLCLWLPIVVAGTYWQSAPPAWWTAAIHPTTLPAATQPATTQSAEPEESPTTETPAVKEMVFPVIVWRVDTIALLVLGLVLLPAAIGRWPLGRRDGVILLVVYVAYLMVVAAAGKR